MSIFGGKKSVKKSTKKSRKQRYKTFLQVSGTEDGAEYGDSGGYESGRGVWKSPDSRGGEGTQVNEDLIRKHYWFSGRVQGVGFRYRACYIASSLGITGWVRNHWDDRVEMEAQGTREELARMIEMLNAQSFIWIEDIEDKVIPGGFLFFVLLGDCIFGECYRRGVCSGGMCAWTQEGRVEDALSAGSDAEGGKF